MNTYAIKSEAEKLYGPFKSAHAAAKWAVKNLRGLYNAPGNWSIVRIFKP